MAEETHGIEIEIDSRPSEAGKQRVIKNLDDIKKKTSEVGQSGAEAGKAFSDGLGSGASSGAGRATKSMDEIRAKARQAGNDVNSAGSGFAAWSRMADSMARSTGASLNDIERRALRTGQQIASGAGSFKNWSAAATQVQRVAGVLDTVGLAARGTGQQIAAGAGSFRVWSQEANKITSAAKSMDDLKRKTADAHKVIQDGAARAASAFRQETLAIDRTLASAARLQPTFAEIEASANRLNRTNPFAKFQGQARAVVPDLLNLRNILLSLGVVELGKYVVNTEATFRGFDQALRIVTGSSAGAAKEMDFARQTAEKYGLRIKDLTSSYVGLLAASRGTNMEGEKSKGVFDAITKAGVAYGLSNDNIRGSLLAVQQMMSKGQVQAEELRGQLGERLPGAFQVAARAMNVTTAELSKMLEQGQVVSSDFLPKFAAQLNKEIPDGVTSAYAAFNKFMNVVDAATRVLANSGVFEGLANGATALAQALGGLVSGGSLATLGSAIGGLMTLLANNIELLKAGAIAYGVYFAAIKVGAVLAWMGELIALQKALGATTAATALFGAGLKGLQAAMAVLFSPLALVTAGVTGLILAFMSISNAGDTATRALSGVGETTKNASLALREAEQRAGLAAVNVTSFGGEASGAVQKVDSFAGAVGNAAQQLYNLAKARQAAALSDLVAQRGKAVAQYNDLQGQTREGVGQRVAQARQNIANTSGLRKVGAIVSGLGAAAGGLRDDAARELGFGPSQEQLRKGADSAKQSVTQLDEAIRLTKSSMEQFVTQQDRAAASATAVVKPNRAIANAMAAVQGATTLADKAEAGLQLVRAQASADLKAGTITQQQYTDRVGAAIQKVHELRDATKAHSTSLAEQRKEQAETNRMLAQADKNAGNLSRITDRYDEQPRYLDQLDKDQKTLDDMQGQWVTVGDAVVEYTKAMHDADTAQLQLAKNKPFADMMQGMDTELALQTKILQGRGLEAEAIRQKIDYERTYGKMLPEQYQNLLAHVTAQESIARALEDQRRIAGMYVQTVNEIQDAFDQFLNSALKNPFKATMDFAKSSLKSIKQLMIREVSESIFGGLDREIEDMVTGKSGVQAANKLLVDTTTQTTTATSTLGDTMVEAARLIRDAAMKTASELTGVPQGGNSGGVTTDGEDIIVTGKKQPLAKQAEPDYRRQVIEKVVGRVGTGLEKLWNSMPKGLQNVVKGIGGTIEGGLKKIGITLPKGVEQISGAINKGLKGAGQGMMASGIVSQLGLKQSQTGAAVGGAIGSFIPGGSFIGGLVGGTIGGLFKKEKKGSAGLTIGSDGLAVAGAVSGRGSAEMKAASGLATNVATSLNDLASQLGGSLSGNTGITLGYRPGHKAGAYRVDTEGRNRVKGDTVLAFDTEAEAVAAAMKIAVKNGVITGISEASQRVLRTAPDTDKAISAAATYEQLLKQAEALRNPISGAFDEIKKGMDTTINQLKAVGYTQDDISKIMSVYQAQQKQALEQMTSGYKAFMDDITKGPDSGLTSMDQFKAAQTDFAKVQAGLADGTTTQDQFTEAGQKLFDLARQTYGTATPEFDAIKNSLVQATQGALDRVNQSAQDAGVITAIQAAADATHAQQTETNQYLAQIAESLSNTGGFGYSGDSGATSGSVRVAKLADY